MAHRLDALGRRYDDYVGSTTQDKRVESISSWQRKKRAAAKNLQKLLQGALERHLGMGMDALEDYSRFDSRFQQTLRRVAILMLKQGEGGLREAFLRWYQRGLKPTETRIQSYDLGLVMRRDANERADYQGAREERHQDDRKRRFKNEGAKSVRNWLARYYTDQLKRGFVAWKSKYEYFCAQRQTVRQTVIDKWQAQMRAAFVRWREETLETRETAKLHFLARDMAEKQLLQVYFSGLKEGALEERGKKERRKGIAWKCWRDAFRKRQFMKRAALQVLGLENSRAESLVTRAFDALRANKAEEKMLKAGEELAYEVPARKELQVVIRDKEVATAQQRRREALACIAKSVGKGAFSYFAHWRLLTQQKKEFVQTRVRMRVLDLFHGRLRAAFNAWKAEKGNVEVKRARRVLAEFQEDGHEMTNHIVDLTQDLTQKRAEHENRSSRQMRKCFRHMFVKDLKMAFRRWKFNLRARVVKAVVADNAAQRLRRRFLRKGFERYRRAVENERQSEFAAKRSVYFRSVLDARTKKRFEALRAFQRAYTLATRCFAKLNARLGSRQVGDAFKKWRAWKEREREGTFGAVQGNLRSDNEALAKQIGEHESALHERRDRQARLDRQLSRQAKKSVANRFARFFFVRQDQAFAQWRAAVDSQKKRERKMRNALRHMQRHAQSTVASCWRAWARREEIAHEEQRLGRKAREHTEMEGAAGRKGDAFEAAKEGLEGEIGALTEQGDKFAKRYNKALNLLVQRTDQNDYMSRKRYLLDAWRAFVRREKRACRHIKSALCKVVWKRAFDRIRGCARHQQRDTAEHKQATRVLRRFLNVRLREAFSLWRHALKRRVQHTTLFAEEEFAAAQGSHSENKTVQADHIERRGVQSIRSNKSRRTLQHWFRMMKVLKKLRLLQAMFLFKQQNMRKKCALRKWNDRKKATVRQRAMVARMRQRLDFRMRRRVMDGWMG